MSGVALFSYNRAAAALGAGAAATMMALVPVLATLLAIPVRGEVLSFFGIAAIIGIALGVMMTTRPSALIAFIKLPNRRYHQ